MKTSEKAERMLMSPAAMHRMEQEAVARPLWTLLDYVEGLMASGRRFDAGWRPEGSVDSLGADDAVGYLDLADAAVLVAADMKEGE